MISIIINKKIIMKNIKYKLGIFLSLILLISGCQEDDYQVGDLIAPTNIQLIVDKVGADASNPNGDGSGTVNFTPTADNATAIHIVIQGVTKLVTSGSISHDFTVLGLVKYPVTVIAYGTGGVSTSKTYEVEVLSLYEPPAELLTQLTNNSSKTWRVPVELPEYFGLGPVGGNRFGEYYPNGSDQSNAKIDTGMYDDRYTFNIDGTFTHDTGEDGFVFGRKGLIDELGGSGGTENGDDIEQYLFGDYSVQYALSAPGGKETISLSGIGFIGYYIGGDHKYEIISRSANELVLRSTDGNGGFDWWFRLIPE